MSEFHSVRSVFYVEPSSINMPNLISLAMFFHFERVSLICYLSRQDPGCVSISSLRLSRTPVTGSRRYSLVVSHHLVTRPTPRKQSCTGCQMNSFVFLFIGDPARFFDLNLLKIALYRLISIQLIKQNYKGHFDTRGVRGFCRWRPKSWKTNLKCL